MKEYDLVVVGSGVGLTVLSQGLSHGLKCALIEDSKMGGTCLTRGCIPSKVLVYPADIIREAEHAKMVGVDLKVEKIDWDLISRRMWHQIDESKDIERGLSAVPTLDIYKGVAEFTGKYKMKVKLNKGGFSDEFKAKKFVLASGARSIIPPIPGLEDVGYVTSESFFAEKFPKTPWKSLVIIGGGIIAAEFAHVFSSFGTDVTIIEMLPRLVSTEEPEISEFLEDQFKKHMKVYTNHKAIEFIKRDDLKIVKAQNVLSGEIIEIGAEEIFLAVGKRSNADILKVEKTGVETDKRGWIKTDQYLETNMKNIWAIGDANGKYMFRHKANYDAEIATRNIFGDFNYRTRIDYSVVPWAIFSYPQIGHVGMTEKEAIESGHEIYKAIKPYSSVAKGFAMGFAPGRKEGGFVKLVVDKSYKILGVHIIGPHAAMLVQPFVYLMNSGYNCPPPDEFPGDLPRFEKACPDAGSFMPIYKSMVIHPSLNEVTGWAIGSLQPVNIKKTGHGRGHSH